MKTSTQPSFTARRASGSSGKRSEPEIRHLPDGRRPARPRGMQIDAGRGGIERGESLCQQTTYDSGEHIAGTGGGQRRVAGALMARAPSGAADQGLAPLSTTCEIPLARGGQNGIQPVRSTTRDPGPASEPGHLARMGSDHGLARQQLPPCSVFWLDYSTHQRQRARRDAAPGAALSNPRKELSRKPLCLLALSKTWSNDRRPVTVYAGKQSLRSLACGHVARRKEMKCCLGEFFGIDGMPSQG